MINSELWKLGQLKAGDKVKFVPVSYHQAKLLNEKYHAQLEALDTQEVSFNESFYPELATLKNAVLDTLKVKTVRRTWCIDQRVTTICWWNMVSWCWI